MSYVRQMKTNRIYEAISKWFETLQGISHTELLKRMVTRNGQGSLPTTLGPRLFLISKDVARCKGYILE